MRNERILLGVVIVSVALNLLLAGAVLGHLAGPDRQMQRLDPMAGVRRLITGLPESRSEALAPYLRRYFSALRPRFRELRSIQQDLRQAMLTDPLNEAALADALGAFQASFADSQGAARDAFVALAAAMTLEERRQLVSAMGEPLRRPDMHLNGPPHGHPPPPLGDPVPGLAPPPPP